jgi:hypothetical protein
MINVILNWDIYAYVCISVGCCFFMSCSNKINLMVTHQCVFTTRVNTDIFVSNKTTDIFADLGKT